MAHRVRRRRSKRPVDCAEALRRAALPDRTPSRAELQQQERTGITGKRVKEDVTAAFRASDGPEAFRAALQEKGYTLARGDRRDYVILDAKGGIHSLARRIDGMKTASLREFMAAMNPESVPNIEQAREIIAERDRRAREIKESHDEARIEAGYSHGDDYVSQTRAALRDHQRRQRAAEEATGSEKPEMSDARRPRLDRLAAASKAEDRAQDRTEDDPNRQNEAPGGGHTRSRYGQHGADVLRLPVGLRPEPLQNFGNLR
jgi:hypothetical protein